MNWQDKIDIAHKGQTGFFKEIEKQNNKTMRLQFIISNRDLVDRFNRAIEIQGDNVNDVIETMIEEYVHENPICEGCDGKGYQENPNYLDYSVDAPQYRLTKCDECN